MELFRGRPKDLGGPSLASVPGLPRSVRVLIMRRRQTFENGEGLGLSITWGRPGVDAMQGAMWVESKQLLCKNAITRMFRAYGHITDSLVS